MSPELLWKALITYICTCIRARMCVSMYVGLGQDLRCLDTRRPGFAAGVGWDCGMGALEPLLLGKTHAGRFSLNT